MIPRSAFVFCGGESICVHSLCMGVGVRTALLAFTQLSSVTEGFKLCWRTGQKLTLKPSFLSFALLRASIMSIRGVRSSRHHPVNRPSTCRRPPKLDKSLLYMPYLYFTFILYLLLYIYMYISFPRCKKKNNYKPEARARTRSRTRIRSTKYARDAST